MVLQENLLFHCSVRENIAIADPAALIEVVEKYGWRAVKGQMAIDCSIVALAFLVIEPTRVLYSVLAAVVMSVFLAVNHRPGRYMAM